MATSLNSVLGFSSKKLQGKYPHASKYFIKPGELKPAVFARRVITCSVTDSDRLGNDTTTGDSDSSESKTLNGSNNNGSVVKRSSLTARERLRAARVLSRYNNNETKVSSKTGSKLLDALKESEKGQKKSGLPEAPTNLLDDSKRGMPKAGLTFDFPGGNDLLVIVISFVFISTVMLGTTFLVWKLGAIHFND